MTEENKLITERKKKLEEIKKKYKPYPNNFKKLNNTATIVTDHSDTDKETLATENNSVSISGRLLTIRNMGNSSFANLHDESGNIQIYLQKKQVGEDAYWLFNNL